MIQLQNFAIRRGGRLLFENATMQLHHGWKIGLTGVNGAGKSTLFAALLGSIQGDVGSLTRPAGWIVAHMAQEVESQETSAIDFVLSGDEEWWDIHQKLEHQVDQLDMDTLTQLYGRFDEIHGYTAPARAAQMMAGLGFLENQIRLPVSSFSGGWRMRLNLARTLMSRSDLLLLDEPTNHLDIESIQWLETFLSTRANAVVLVSHDRAFINNVTTRTIEISCGHIYDYKVSYDQYVILRKERREQQLRPYENQQKQIQDTEDFIERFRYKATKAVQVQSRIKQLEKIERIEVDEEDNSALRLKFPPASRSGSYPIICEDVQKKYGNHVVFRDVNLTINRGDKVAFVGKNGEGKSTLVKCIMNEIDFKGKLELGHNVKIGYFAQNQAQLLDENLTVFETIDYVAVGDVRTKIRDILGAFMFGGEASDKKVKVLSGGERTRLAMIRLLLEPVNLLILDEPTNHLDIASKEVLKTAIREFDGTAIIVSHDRDFLNGLVDKIYEFGGGKVLEHIGGIYDFLSKKRLENLQQLELSKSPVPSKQKEKEESISENKLSYQEQKEQNRLIKRKEKEIQEAEEKITKLDERISEMEIQLSTPEGASDLDLLQKYLETKNKLDVVMNNWERLTLELEDLKTV